MATRKVQPETADVLIARFAEYVAYLEALGYSQYQVGTRMGKAGHYVGRALKKKSCPDAMTLFEMVDKWHLNPLWYFTGRGSRVLDKEKLQAIPILTPGGNRFH